MLNNRPDSSNLERLRNRTFNNLATLGELEGFPDLSAGKMREAGASVNFIANRHLSFFSDRRFSIGAKAIYRGERYKDEANTAANLLQAGWDGTVQAYWESQDKRWSVELIVSRIGARNADESVGIAFIGRF